MKIMFDIIYSTQPHQCSSASKFKKIALRLLDLPREDVFIYWPIPPWADENARAWLPKSDRIKYIEFNSTKDRVREYQILYKELEHLVAFNGNHWDFDILMTMRTQQAPNLKVLMNSPRHFNMTWMKRLFVLEEMAVFDFRKTVPVSDPFVQDLMTSAGYLCSDKSYITAGHVRKGALQAARQYYSPSMVRKIEDKLALVNPAVFEDFIEKEDKFKFKKGEQPFCLGFVGRMSNSMTRLETIYSIMDKHWILKGDQGFKVIFSTVSTVVKLKPPEFCVMENNPRDKFWQRVKEDMHLVISLSIDAEFSMSLIEPVMFGTPLVLAREPWTESLFGADYPFFADTEMQAYMWVKEFHDDYAKYYAKFLDWRENSFKKRFSSEGVYGKNLYDDLMLQVDAWEKDVTAKFLEKPNKENNNIVQLMLKQAGDRTEFEMFEMMKELEASGELRNIGDKVDDDARDLRSLTFSTPWNEYRLILQVFHGWKDASTKLGHMKK